MPDATEGAAIPETPEAEETSGAPEGTAEAPPSFFRLLGNPRALYRYAREGWVSAWAYQKAGERAAMVAMLVLGLTGLVGGLCFGTAFFAPPGVLGEWAPFAAIGIPVILALWNWWRKRWAIGLIILTAGQTALLTFVWAVLMESQRYDDFCALHPDPDGYGQEWHDWFEQAKMAEKIQTFSGNLTLGLASAAYAVAAMVLIVWISPFLRYPEDRFHFRLLRTMRPRERPSAFVALAVTLYFIVLWASVLVSFRLREWVGANGARLMCLAPFLSSLLLGGLVLGRERARWAVQFLFTILLAHLVFGLTVLLSLWVNDATKIAIIKVETGAWIFLSLEFLLVLYGLKVLVRARREDQPG